MDSVTYKNGKLIWRNEVNDELRQGNIENWNTIKEHIKEATTFMKESREYRAADSVRQKFIAEEVAKTNGRVTVLEDYKKSQETKNQDRKDSKLNTQALIMIISTVIMAVSAAVMIFRPR